jgi:hypothetical protein
MTQVRVNGLLMAPDLPALRRQVLEHGPARGWWLCWRGGVRHPGQAAAEAAVSGRADRDFGQDASFVFCLTAIALKLAGVISWSWWWVLSPLWISGLLAAAVLCAGKAPFRDQRKQTHASASSP